MTAPDAAVLEDRDRLEDWLISRGFVPYVDYEVLAVTLEDSALEIDPMGHLSDLQPALESFARSHGFVVMPFDPETGSVTILRWQSKPLYN